MLLDKTRTSSFTTTIVLVILILSLVIDTTLSNVSDLLQINAAWWSLPIFALIIALSFGIGQYFILGYLRDLTKKTNRNYIAAIPSRAVDNTDDATRFMPRNSAYPRSLTWLNRTVTTAQYYILAPIIVLVVLQLMTASYYYPFLITAAMTVSYVLSSIIFGLLSIRFFQWYLRSRYDNTTNLKKSESNEGYNTTVLFYALASSVTTISVILTLVFYDSVILTSFRDIITSIVYMNSTIVFPTFGPNSVMSMTNSIYSMFNIISFVLLWICSILLLRQYMGNRKFSSVRLLFLLFAPLLFFLSQFVVLAIPSAKSDVYLITSYTLQGLVAGLLFGIPFLFVSRRITIQQCRRGQEQEQEKQYSLAPIKEYLPLSAYGFILFFVSGTATLVHTPYPPFGLVSVSFVGLSSYLIFVGLYYTAVAISQDSSLRYSIRRFATAEREGGGPRLLDSIGTAQMQHDIENRVSKLVREQADVMNKQTGVYLSPTEEDIRQYLNDVLTEISEAKGQERRRTNKG